jgi:hypothetical protein
MKSFFRTLTLTSIICAVSEFALAAPITASTVRGAPAPEIGDGVVGVAVATIALLTFVMLPRIKRLLQS